MPISTRSIRATAIAETGTSGVLEVDLDALAANWQSLRTRHAGEVGAVLKANAYGIGAKLAAARLYREGCRHFFVAHLDEALAIRALVPAAMLAVLNGLLPGAEAEHVAHDITPALGSLDELARWSASARQAGRTLPALLHVDTGMARLGLDSAELRLLAAERGRLEGVTLRYVMTHLVSAELPDDPVNRAQHGRFAAACAMLPTTPRSFANSSGVFLGSDFASDLARPGAALYGVNPTPGHDNPMRAVVRLRARVLQIREIVVGESVGYNATWVADAPARIATLGVGYADGWPRSLSGRGAAFFDGRPVPLVGRVSMDLTTYDVTQFPEMRTGDWLDLIGPGCPVDSVAAQAGTNGYEILTSLGRRYARVVHGA